MQDAVIWGTGGVANSIMKKRVLLADYNIVAFVDNNPEKWGTIFYDMEVKSPDIIMELEFSAVIVCANQKNYEKIREQLIKGMKVAGEKVIRADSKALEDKLVCTIKEKYRDSEDAEINNILKKWETTGFNIFGAVQLDMDKCNYVKFDDENWPYILFENKRMYFPKDYPFSIVDGHKVVRNILAEQAEDSPHLYIKEGCNIKDGSIIVDAGTCEGNFALRYIEKAKKVYLVENDPKWMEALKRTFNPYKEKVVFCQKFLSRYDTSDSITLDTLVEEKIDYLKMDIEGAEVDALLGGRNILTGSKAYCSICSYHRYRDEEYISFLLNNYGYEISKSSGYMFFVYDPFMAETMDFRRGIVYGMKQ
jgi:hypothetical protein